MRGLMSILYLVATPIGNLEDITARALRILREVPLIAAEDTRQTRKLLQHYDFKARLTSYHEHNKQSKLSYLLEALDEGDVALVSDAGTPALNDPGYELVRAALDAGHEVRPIPGPSAPIAALVASGLPTDSFLYLGYLARRSAERVNQLKEVAQLPYTLIFLETPHRLLQSLEQIEEILGDREIAIARELTKVHEEIFRGRISAARVHFEEQTPRGEFTLVLAGFSGEGEVWPAERTARAVRAGLERNLPASQLASQVASESGWPKKKVYRLVVALQKDRS